jgi:hypothetical protein
MYKRVFVLFVVGLFTAIVFWGSYASKDSRMGAEQASVSASTLAIENDDALNVVVYVAFGSDSAVTPSSLSLCRIDAGLTCDFVVKGHSTQEIPIGGRYLNATIAFSEPVGCGATKAELNLNNSGWYDTADVSLVDGFNAPVAIDLYPLDAGTAVRLGPVTSAEGNEKAYGVFPLGCDICVARQNPPCGMRPGKAGCKAGPNQYRPDVICQYQGASFGGGERVVVRRL